MNDFLLFTDWHLTNEIAVALPGPTISKTVLLSEKNENEINNTFDSSLWRELASSKVQVLSGRRVYQQNHKYPQRHYIPILENSSQIRGRHGSKRAYKRAC